MVLSLPRAFQRLVTREVLFGQIVGRQCSGVVSRQGDKVVEDTGLVNRGKLIGTLRVYAQLLLVIVVFCCHFWNIDS